MNSSQILGLVIVVLSGLWIGGSGWPIKLMRYYKYEHIGLVCNIIGLLICPWVITLLFCPHAIEAYRSVDPAVLVKSNLFSLAWGVANILALMCYLRIGFCLTGGILVGVAIPIGVVTPMIFKGSGLFSNAPSVFSTAGLAVLTGAVVMLAGVCLVAVSALGRERILDRTSTVSRKLGVGLVMAVAAGVLSVGNSFSFVYSQGPIVSAMKAHGAGDIPANFAVWAVGLLAGGLINVLYPVWLLIRNKTWGVFSAHPRELLLCVIGGMQGCVAFTIMGWGMVYLGALGASVGFGVSQAMQMVGGQIVGFAWGEWKGVNGKPRHQMYLAIAILIVAVCIMAAANSLSGS
jgi:hypothetical protein